jgi:hypothetical protein
VKENKFVHAGEKVPTDVEGEIICIKKLEWLGRNKKTST